MSRIAHEVVIDYDTPGVRMDGLPFPYHVTPDIDVESLDGALGLVTLRVYARNVSVLSRGRRAVIQQASQKDELEWAAERGREIVRDGLADVLRWLDEARQGEGRS